MYDHKHDLLISLAFEAIWVILIIELSGVLTLHWLEPLFGGFIIFLPACIFALGLLILLGYMRPRFYSVIIGCVIFFVIFPFLGKIFNDAFHAWEMAENDGWEVLVHIAFWLVSLVLQLIALVIGQIIREKRR